MPMNFDENNYTPSNESIFSMPNALDSNLDNFNISSKEIEEATQKPGLLNSIIRAISSNILQEQGPEHEEKVAKLNKILNNLIDGNDDLFDIMDEFGCTFIYEDDHIRLHCEKYNLDGTIIVKPDRTAEFDETAKKILYIISKVIVNTDSMNNTFDTKEEEGFYPVGELTKQKVILNGKEVEVFVGTLMNKEGETKQIMFHNGKEIIPKQE